MKILTILAAASAVALSSAGAFAAEPINPDYAVRQSIYDVSRHNDRVTARMLRGDDRYVRSARAEDRPYGPRYQSQDQVRQSIYDVNAGKKGNISEYQ